MTTKRTRSEEYRDRIRPFLEEWEERGFTDWQQFRNWSVQQILWDAGLSMDQVEDITRVDGQGDEGIDAWYVDESATPQRLVLIQAKDQKIAREDFSKMRDGLLNLLEPNRPLNANRALLEKASMFKHALPEQFEVDMYLTSSVIAQQNLTPDSSGEPLNTEEVLFPHLERQITFYWHVRDIKFLVENIQVMHDKPIDAVFVVEKESLFEYRVGGHTRTITAAIRADELAYLFQQQKQNLFRRNPRYYLGTMGLRNAALKKTLMEPQNEDFYIYNNGLTCVAYPLRVEPEEEGSHSVQIIAKDFQIVNGCQTTATLAEVAPKKDISKVRVLAKIIETPHAGSEESDVTSDYIAERSNSQNPLKAEDWKANDRRQRVWHDEFLRRTPDPWFYEIKRGTWGTVYREASKRLPFKDTMTGRFRKMTMKDLGQECWAFLGFPAEAKDKPRQIFNDSRIYDVVFAETLTASQLLLPHIIYEAADAKTRAERTYALLPTDLDYERYKDAHVATEHLRHSIVAAIGRMLCALKNSPPAYPSHSESTALVANSPDWLTELVGLAFSELARKLLLESARSGTGPRSIVRSNEWMKETLHYLTERVKGRVEDQRSAGTQPGTLAHALKVLLP